MFTHANAPAPGRQGVSVHQLPGQNTTTSTERMLQAQGLVRRYGMSETIANLVIGLLREEPWK